MKANSSELMKQLQTNESAFEFNTTKKAQKKEAKGASVGSEVYDDSTILWESETNLMGHTQAFVEE